MLENIETHEWQAIMQGAVAGQKKKK